MRPLFLIHTQDVLATAGHLMPVATGLVIAALLVGCTGESPVRSLPPTQVPSPLPPFATSQGPTQRPETAAPTIDGAPNETTLLVRVRRLGLFPTSLLLDPSTRSTVPIPEGYTPISWSPSGASLLLLGQQDPSLYISTPDGRDPHLLFSPPRGECAVWAFWLDEDSVIAEVFTSSIEYSLWMVHPSGRSPLPIPSTDGMRVLAASPSLGLWIAGSLFPPDYGAPRLYAGVSAQAFPDQGRIAYWDTSGTSNPAMAFSADGTELFYAADTSARLPNTPATFSVRSLHLPDLEGLTQARTLLDLERELFLSLSPSPDGRTLAVLSSSGLYLVDLATGARLHSPVLPPSFDREGLAWSPDSTALALRYRGSNFWDYVIMVDVTTGKAKELLKEQEVHFRVVGWRNAWADSN